MRDIDNPIIDPYYKDEPTVKVIDPYEVKYSQCSRCGERTAEADMDDGICDICREEMEEKK